MNVPSLRFVVVTIAVLCGCAAPRGRWAVMEGESSGGTGAGGSQKDVPDDNNNVRLDVGSVAGSEGDDGAAPPTCKIDFLFVVDNSGSMMGEQVNLASSFPGFIATIESVVQTDDYHIMVVDSDADPYAGCHQYCQTVDPNTCGGVISCAEVNGSPYGQPCDYTLGAGVVYPRGLNASNRACAIEGTQRYVAPGQPDLLETFACMATVGTSGEWDETPMGALQAAVSPDLIGAGGCNEGFIRHDAILVVTIVTDAGIMSSEEAKNGNPAAWMAVRSAVVAAKGGDEKAIAVLGLLPDNDQAGALCSSPEPWDGQSPTPNPMATTFVQSFGEQGVLASVCEPDFTGFFEQAVRTVIRDTCDNFTAG